jgi:hypothetical protein
MLTREDISTSIIEMILQIYVHKSEDSSPVPEVGEFNFYACILSIFTIGQTERRSYIFVSFEACDIAGVGPGIGSERLQHFDPHRWHVRESHDSK